MSNSGRHSRTGKGTILSFGNIDELSSAVTSVLQESISEYSSGARLLAGRTRKLMEGERRRVAVLFLDLTGFTGLGQVLDHEVLHDLVFRIMGFFSSVVESYGGYVDKFEGDRLMALFGAMSAAENDSARAVGCALRIMDVLEELGPSLPQNMVMNARAGIHTGPVTVAPDPSGHLTATGSTVNMASRIEETASPGMVTVSESARRECGDLFSFSRLGDFQIRDFSTPVSLYVPLGPGKLKYERWERSARLAGAPLIDRKKERATLETLLGRTLAESGSTGLLTIRGEAGIGKSRLLHHFLKGTGDQTVLHGHARRYSQTPFWIWIDLLRHYFGISSQNREEISGMVMALADDCENHRLGNKIRQEAGRLTELLRMNRNGTEGHTPEESHSIIVAIRLALDAIGTGNDLIIALEDVHWMDTPSSRVLDLFIESGGGPSSTLIIVTERPFENSSSTRAGDWDVMELKPLGDGDINSISSYLLSDGAEQLEFDGTLTEFIAGGARGNPFYAEELVLSLLESGGIRKDGEGVWRLTMDPDRIEVPSSVRSLVQSRVDMLPAPERKMLQMASVIGVSFAVRVLDEVMSRLETGIEIKHTGRGLIKKGYLSENGGMMSFRHDLVQSSVYGTLLRHNRRILHGIAAGVYEDIYSEETAAMAPIIFEHWKLSGNRDRTIEWAVRALSIARENEQGSELLKIAGTILELVDEDSQGWEWRARIEALNVRHWVLARFGDVTDAMDIIDTVLKETGARNEPGEEASAIRLKCILLNEIGEFEHIEDLYRLALEKAREAGDRALTASIYSTMANHYSDTGLNGAAMEYYRKAREILRETGNRHRFAALKTNLANLLSRTGERERATKEFRDAVRVSRELGLRSTLGYALNGYAINMAMDGNLKKAGELFEEALEYQIDIGNKTLQSSILNNLGVLTRMTGDHHRSLKYRLEALKLARESSNMKSEAIALVNVANMYRLLGDFQSALELSGSAFELAERIRDPLSACHALSIQGMIRILMEDIGEALSLYERALSLVEKKSIDPGAVDDFQEFMDMLRERDLSIGSPSNWSDEEDA
ncbi:MAG: tetratricopeptide repeat protein [Candidatus Aegiribacteria sp.]